MKIFLFIMLMLPFGAYSETTTTEDKLAAALENERRTDEEKVRDRNRKPIETLAFFRLRDDMTVLELLPGGGWYTKILGPVLAESGKLYVSIGTDRVSKLIEEQAQDYPSTEVIPFDTTTFSRPEGERRFTLPEFSFGIRKVDLVLTFRNMHNFTPLGRSNLNIAAFQTLKKGGYYGVVDHTRRHMQSDSYEAWRRMDPVQIIKEVEAAGFRFVDYSDLHYRPDDELRHEVGRKTVTGNTDRFTLLFEKP
jgi:predicted methyltransferase